MKIKSLSVKALVIHQKKVMTYTVIYYLESSAYDNVLLLTKNENVRVDVDKRKNSVSNHLYEQYFCVGKDCMVKPRDFM